MEPREGTKAATVFPQQSPSRSQEASANRAGALAVENGLHYILDVTCGENACRFREQQAVRNLSCLRKIALNMLQLARRRRPKDSIKTLQKRASWNNEVLQSVLLQPLSNNTGK